MPNIRFKIILFCSLIQLCLDAGPTHRHLESNPLDKIIQTLEQGSEKKIEHLLEISNKESDGTFFGYHGMTQQSRLFQDILRAVVEEVLRISLPDDFYFLRIPGEKKWNWENGKDSFLDKFEKMTMPEPYQELIIKNLLALIEKEQGFVLKWEAFSKDERLTIWNYFQSYIEYSVKTDWNKQAKKYSLPQGYLLKEPIFNKHLPAIADVLENKVFTLYPKADHQSFRLWFDSKFADFYDVYTVFLLKELNIDDDKILSEIDRFFLPFDDTHQPQQSLLVALNVPLFGNYLSSGCFTPKIVLENQSILGGEKHIQKLLAQYFEQIGLDPALVSPLWEAGEKILKDAGNNQGCLLQFYDESASVNQKPFSFVDKNAFLSLKHALPVQNLVPSDYIQGHYSLENKSRDLELRMVMNNQTILNPFSTMRMNRYDGSSPEEREKIILTMKELLKDSVKDEVKLQQYRNLLVNLWDKAQESI